MDELKHADALTEKEFLRQYKPKDYPRPAVTVDILIFALDENKEKPELLLIKRKHHPFMGSWAIPGGFVEMEEDLESAARRELQEECGAQVQKLSQLYTFGAVRRDPRMRVISVAYAGIIRKEDGRIKAGDDAAQEAWFAVRQEKDCLFLRQRDGLAELCYSVQEDAGVCRSKEALAFDHFDIVWKGWNWLKQLKNEEKGF